jgi:hypothetical protein
LNLSSARSVAGAYLVANFTSNTNHQFVGARAVPLSAGKAIATANSPFRSQS